MYWNCRPRAQTPSSFIQVMKFGIFWAHVDLTVLSIFQKLWLVWGEPTVSNPGPTPHILSKSTICFCSNVLFSFLHLSVCSFIFLASVCPSIYCAAIERMFTSRCLCAIIRQCRITLSLCWCTPLRFFVFLNRNCSHMFYCFPVQRNCSGSTACSVRCWIQNAELSPFSRSAQGAGKGPFKTRLRSLIGDGIKPD